MAVLSSARVFSIYERDISWLASIRGRIGYAADRWLLYVTGGAAWMQADYTAGPNWVGIYQATKFDHTSSGWVIGGGFEYAFTNNWTARLEYLHYDFDDVTFINPFSAAPGIGLDSVHNFTDNSINVVRAGVNYKF